MPAINTFPAPPKPHIENRSSIADFAELECLKRPDFNVSVVDVTNIILRSDTFDDTDEDRSEVANVYVTDAFSEIEDRRASCGDNAAFYPFEVMSSGTLVKYRGGEDFEEKSLIYLYLLLATQLNMSKERKHAGIDGAELFEELCAETALNFIGGPSSRANRLVFGTSRFSKDVPDEDVLATSGFESAVNDLCEQLREGLAFRHEPGRRVHAKDGKLDIVVWRNFADKRHGQLIGFGQCKTGTHWKNDLSKLRPENFCGKWFKESLAVTPFRMYFVADRVCSNWRDHCIEGGILFDRCRIVEYCDRLPADLTKKIEKWVVSVTTLKKLVIK